MAQLMLGPPVPVVLGVALTISRFEPLRPPLARRRTRFVRLRIDPSLELIYLIEATLPGNMECLTSLTQPNLNALTLQAARVELLPGVVNRRLHHGPTLTALSSGNCFLTSHNRKALIASFSEDEVQPEVIHMQVQNRLNLLDYLRTDWFTVELSGTHRRRLNQPLAARLQLEFETRASTF
jgi:hypothetical protein